MRDVERIDTVVIGAGQAGLAVGHHLQRLGVPFVILESNERVGDSWRSRWDSLRLFTPARYDGIDGMPFPAPASSFPTKDEMADYLERYATHFALPVRTSVRVERVARRGATLVVETTRGTIEAQQVVVAMANYQRPRVPSFAAELDRSISQLHSAEYRNPQQVVGGTVLVVGAANSGAEIGLDLARAGRRVIVAGRHPGHVPWNVDSVLGQHVLGPMMLRFVFHRVLTTSTPIGRKARRNASHRGVPLIRQKPKDLAGAGVERVGRVVGVRDGRPLLDDGRVPEIDSVVWCTGFDPSFSWIELPVFGPDGQPIQERGVSTTEPGLYFVGVHFQYAMSSTMVHGVSRDARYVAERIAERQPSSMDEGARSMGATTTGPELPIARRERLPRR